jgi:hypothetical protein
VATTFTSRPRASNLPYLVSGAAALVSALAAGLTFFVPGVLRGPAVMNGSGRGTAAAALFVAVPVLVAGMFSVRNGSVRSTVLWLGAAAFLLYNAVLFLFITPFNQLFLFYVAMFCLNFWAIVIMLRWTDVPMFGRRFTAVLPARILGAYLVSIGVLNGLAWLVSVVPAVFDTKPPGWLAGTGNITNPVYVQDLSFWVPLLVVSGVWLWQRRAWGVVLAGALLVFTVIESVSIALDQWMGSAADPNSGVASAAATPVFGVVAAIGLVALFFYFQNLNRARRSA